VSDSESLFGAANQLLIVAAAILAQTPAGAPTRQFVSHGPPAFDCCDTLCVHAGLIQYADFRRSPPDSAGGMNDPKAHVVPYIPLVVTALRCANAQPSGGLQVTLPTAAALSLDAQVVYRDGWSLYIGLNEANRNGTLFTGWPCRAFEIDGALPISPDGGCLGWAVGVNVQIDGFDVAGV
jgi:hypothetical protein